MRGRVLLLVAAALLGAGCLQMLEDELEEDRREARGDAPEESVEDDEAAAEVPHPPTATPPQPAPPTQTPPPPSAPPSPPAPTLPAPEPEPWPREGSHVALEATTVRAASDGSYREEARAEARWTYADGDWTGTCTLDAREHVEGRGWTQRVTTRTYTIDDPPHWPLFDTRSPPAPGGEVEAWFLDGCDIAHATAAYAGTDGEPATRDGRAVVAATHVAVDDGERGAQMRTEWSRGTGLVLAWERTRAGTLATTFEGRLVDTDAPL